MTNLRKYSGQMTVPTAAQYLNVPERTIRHHLKTKKLLGHKVGKEWFIDRASVDAFAQRYGFVTGPLEPEIMSAEDISQESETSAVRFMPREASTEDNAKSAPDPTVDSAKETDDESRHKKKAVRSLFSLRVFQLSLEAFKDIDFTQLTKIETQSIDRIRASKLDYFSSLGRGFYTYHYREKIVAYRDARNSLAEIVALLLITPHTQAQAKKIESEVLPALGALLRLTEKNHATRMASGQNSAQSMMPTPFVLQPAFWGRGPHEQSY